jgi:hypothetical protein
MQNSLVPLLFLRPNELNHAPPLQPSRQHRLLLLLLPCRARTGA